MIGFEELYRDYAGSVYRYALRLCGDAALAEDIVSETFLRVWTAPHGVRFDTARAYLFAIARNLFLQGLRRTSRQVAMPAEEPSMSSDYEAQEQAHRVMQALQELPEIDRSAILLRAEEDLSYEEIAQVLKISAVAARVKVHRARAKLAALCGR